ncbi:hypothetical protein HK099_001849 [Clydaea vesicula]|uniref:NADH dehydrogenase subunit 11 n=1 Tax=Clydaea vesicula TaxID=447962 RepID=A0AAD5U358_9FUNG|nr:hypothetical protein HK099_001849 [Clydaea vesicula]
MLRRLAFSAINKRLFSNTSIRKAEIEIFINDKPIKVEQGVALIQACEKAGIEIPRFCYHERLSVAGNCRMCLVEIVKSPKPAASCAMPAMPGMRILTDSPLVRKAREGVMEFMLSNHPLDCPICDQGGECDLQDQSIRFGSDRSRFSEFVGKRATEDKEFGPLVKTNMTRCIHCTRCVRFANEVGGAEELGTSGRGNDLQIGTYITKPIDSEMSGNVIDLCPVGALTSKPYSFTNRPWELKSTESIDALDAVGSNIKIDSRGLEVMRILPRLNDDINEEWISDKTRFAYDGLKTQRLEVPLIRKGEEFVPVTWPEALKHIKKSVQGIKGEEMTAFAGQLADAESLTALKDFFNLLGSENLRLDGRHMDQAIPSFTDFRSNYVMNSTINGIEEADVLLMIGTNPRQEAALVNSRIRKAFLRNNLQIGVLGNTTYAGDKTLNYFFEDLGKGVEDLKNLEKSSFVTEKLKKAKKPLILVGQSLLERSDSVAILQMISKLSLGLKSTLVTESWNGFNFLHRAASWTAALDIGFAPAKNLPTTPKFIYLLNADDIQTSDIPSSSFVVYQGHHGDAGAHYADVILPGSAYTEKDATYVNTEGRTQVTRAAVSPPGVARDDWKIIRALSEVFNVKLPYDDLQSIRKRMGELSPTLVQYDNVEKNTFTTLGLQQLSENNGVIDTNARLIDSSVKDYYLTDPISRSSSTMAKCSQVFFHKKESLKESIIAV